MAGQSQDEWNRWTWAAARSTGTSHIKAGKGCDDFGACLEVSGTSNTVLVAVASDGAGSATHSSFGSKITTRAFVRCASRYVMNGGDISELSQDLIRGWLDDIRDRIAVAALRISATRREFAATLVGCLIGAESSIFLHVGDGASVYRAQGESEWKVPTWPAQGEYAATTFFVTDDPEPNYQFTFIPQRINELAVFSDGLERLGLQFSTKSAFSPLFDKLFVPLSASHPGKNRNLSRALQTFLDGPSVCEKTDDDKILILAKRHVEEL